MMRKIFTDTTIRLRGVRQNNLKSIDLDLPKRRLIVVTGLSGSGKSSLAFETLFAEGQRRYIETFLALRPAVPGPHGQTQGG
jgi:excinuclease ABC subunit A